MEDGDVEKKRLLERASRRDVFRLCGSRRGNLHEDRCDRPPRISGHGLQRAGDRIEGAAPLLVGEIAKKLEIPFESLYMGSWAEAQAAAREGKADMIIGVYYNDERAQYLEYVQPPFVYDPVQVFVPNDESFEFLGQDDLIGKKGVANEGESFGTNFDAFIKDKLTVTRVDGPGRVHALMSGNADYAIAAYYPGTAELQRLDLDDKIRPLEPSLSEELFVAFSKKSLRRAGPEVRGRHHGNDGGRSFSRARARCLHRMGRREEPQD